MHPAGKLAQGQDTLSDLCAGMYFVVVGNGDGCTAIDTALVTPSQTITPEFEHHASDVQRRVRRHRHGRPNGRNSALHILVGQR
jgi:hypothetical protein